jgi:hypothetical protein
VRKREIPKKLDRYYDVHLRMPGKLKKEMLEYANKIDISLNELIIYAVWEFIRNEKNIPSPGTPQFSLTTPQEALAMYLSGQTVLQPCGQRECEMKITELNGMKFCDTCNVRVS